MKQTRDPLAYDLPTYIRYRIGRVWRITAIWFLRLVNWVRLGLLRLNMPRSLRSFLAAFDDQRLRSLEAYEAQQAAIFEQRLQPAHPADRRPAEPRPVEPRAVVRRLESRPLITAAAVTKTETVDHEDQHSRSFASSDWSWSEDQNQSRKPAWIFAAATATLAVLLMLLHPLMSQRTTAESPVTENKPAEPKKLATQLVSASAPSLSETKPLPPALELPKSPAPAADPPKREDNPFVTADPPVTTAEAPPVVVPPANTEPTKQPKATEPNDDFLSTPPKKEPVRFEDPEKKPQPPPEAKIAFSRRPPDRIEPGVPYTYSIIVRNNGDQEVSRVNVEESLPPNHEFRDASPIAEPRDGVLQWEIANLQPRGERTITVTLLPPAPPAPPKIEPKPEPAVEAKPMPAPIAEPAAPLEPTAKPIAQVKLEVLAPEKVSEGQPCRIGFRATNLGPKADHIRVYLDLPQGLRYERGRQLEYEVGTLGENETREDYLTVVPTSASTVNVEGELVIASHEVRPSKVTRKMTVTPGAQGTPIRCCCP